MIEHRLQYAKIYLKDAFELYTKRGASIVQHQGRTMLHIKPCGRLSVILRGKKSGNIWG